MNTILYNANAQPTCKACGGHDITCMIVARWDGGGFNCDDYEPSEKEFRCQNEECDLYDEDTKVDWL